MKVLGLINCCICLSLIMTSSLAAQNHKTRANSSYTSFVESVSTATVRVRASISYQIRKQASATNLSPQIEDRTVQSGGSGFVLDKKWNIVTANHVIDAKALESRIEEREAKVGSTVIPGSVAVTSIQVIFQLPNVDDSGSSKTYNVGSAHNANVLKQDRVNDVAILSSPELLWKQEAECKAFGDCDHVVISQLITKGKATPVVARWVQYRIDQPLKGDEISVLGFPAILGHEEGVPTATLNYGRISVPMYVDHDDRTVYLAELRVNEGDSGGPAFEDSDGNVIGLVAEYIKTPNGSNSGQTIIIPIKYILLLVSN